MSLAPSQSLPQNEQKCTFLNIQMRGWKHGSGVKSICYSWRNSAHNHPLHPVSGDLTTLDFIGTHTVHIHIHRQHIHIHTHIYIRYKINSFYFKRKSLKITSPVLGMVNDRTLT